VQRMRLLLNTFDCNGSRTAEVPYMQ
jgi:hypothetical protein